MIRVLSERTEEIRHFHSAPWSFQQTFLTPLKDLNRFVSVVLAPFSLVKATLSTDEVVFEPKHILQLMIKNSIELENIWEWNLQADGQEDVATLLETALSDWVDFSFLPVPDTFAIYADHDEYATFYSREELIISCITRDLTIAGFEPIKDYFRRTSGNKLR